jgi:septum formation protein
VTPAPTILLASGSAIRAQILRSAGVRFAAMRPLVDEDVLKREAGTRNLSLEATALHLARGKALSVEAPGALVIGSDQILEFEGRAFDKPKSRAEATARLVDMQGAEHTLINATAIARDGAVVFEHLERPRLRMRALTEGEIGRYLERAGDEALLSVGAYQVEGLGAQLFERIEGDYFAVLGLSLLPLLAALRREGARL